MRHTVPKLEGMAVTELLSYHKSELDKLQKFNMSLSASTTVPTVAENVPVKEHKEPNHQPDKSLKLFHATEEQAEILSIGRRLTEVKPGDAVSESRKLGEADVTALPTPPKSVVPLPAAPKSETVKQFQRQRGGLQREEVTALWRQVLCLGSIVIVLAWFSDFQKTFQFSIPHLVCYNVLCFRVPDVLGNSVVSSLDNVHLYTSPTLATTAISTSYMIAMQLYLLILKWICQSMGASHLFPRFQFVAQMYYYLFWYVMLMVVSPGGVEDWNFWVMVAMLNGNNILSNLGVTSHLYSVLRCRARNPEPALKILFDSKLAVQDQLSDILSLLIVPAVATSFHVCSSMSLHEYPTGVVVSLWERFGVLLAARILSGLLTEEIHRRRVDLLHRSDTKEVQLLPCTFEDGARYLNDLCTGHKITSEPMRNIERCEFYFTAVAITCTFAAFGRGDIPARYAFVAFGA